MQVNATELYNYITTNSVNAVSTSGDSSSIFADLFSTGADTIEEWLGQGLSDSEIEDKFIAMVKDVTQDSSIINNIKSVVSSLIEEAKEVTSKSDDNTVQQSQAENQTNTETATVPSTTSATSQTAATVDASNIATSPVSTGSVAWSVSNTANLFAEGTSLDNFSATFNQLISGASTNDNDMTYLNNINTIGSENFFNAIDTNNNGVLEASEINVFSNQDGDATSISAEEFNNVFNQALSKLNSNSPTANNTSVADTAETEATKKSNGNSKSSGSGGSSGSDASDVPKGDSLDDLRKQREKIITDSDKEIADLNAQLDSLISESSADDTLKKQYQDAKSAYDENEAKIKTNETQLNEYNVNLHQIESNLAAANGEKDNLKTDTDDAEVNSKNAARITELEKTISDLNAEKKRIQDLKTALETDNNGLKSQSTNLKTAVDTALSALSAGLPPEVQQNIASLKEQISAAESNKTQKLAEIDAKIKTKEAEEVEQSKSSGELRGKLSSDEFGSKIVETALKYLGDSESNGRYKKFSTGSYGWCADFVSYVVKEVCKDGGMSSSAVKDVAKHLGASPQKLSNRNSGNYYNIRNMSSSELQEFARTKLQPGMAFICKGSGASGQHTGFVASVDYENGTITTVEGNSNNMVRQRTRKISDLYGFVDFSYLYNT